jgi:hypothetical protein
MVLIDCCKGRLLLPVAVFFLAAVQVLFPQDAAGVPVAAEIQNIERLINRQGVSAAERHDALVRLARLHQLSGDLEGAAKSWLEAATAEQNKVDDAALLSCAYCLAAMGEWDRASLAIKPLLLSNKRAQFLDSCVKIWSSGDVSALSALADDPEFLELKSEMYYTLWKTAENESLAETWKQRLLAEFPHSPEGRIAASHNSISARPSPLWMLFPGRGSFSLVEETAGLTPVNSPAETGSIVKLQTGLFSREINAQAQITNLKKAGFSPSLEKRNSNGNELWAVIVPAGQDVTRSIRELRSAGFDSFPLK